MPPFYAVAPPETRPTGRSTKIVDNHGVGRNDRRRCAAGRATCRTTAAPPPHRRATDRRPTVDPPTPAPPAPPRKRRGADARPPGATLADASRTSGGHLRNTLAPHPPPQPLAHPRATRRIAPDRSTRNFQIRRTGISDRRPRDKRTTNFRICTRHTRRRSMSTPSLSAGRTPRIPIGASGESSLRTRCPPVGVSGSAVRGATAASPAPRERPSGSISVHGRGPATTWPAPPGGGGDTPTANSGNKPRPPRRAGRIDPSAPTPQQRAHVPERTGTARPPGPHRRGRRPPRARPPAARTASSSGPGGTTEPWATSAHRR